MDATARKAATWRAANMTDEQFADRCHYVKSGWGIWEPSEHGVSCTCRPIPKSYAPHLAAPTPTNEAPPRGEW